MNAKYIMNEKMIIFKNKNFSNRTIKKIKKINEISKNICYF